jgi:carbamoyltransferase
MTTCTLGINAAYHDCAACLVADGELIAAAEEERFTHVKHGKRAVPFTAWQLPYHAIDFCLRQAGIGLAEVGHVAYSYDPAQLPSWPDAREATISLPLQPSAHARPGESPWEALFMSYLANAPRQLASGAPHALEARFEGVRHDGPFRWHYVEHHAAHEASAYLAAPFEDCAVLTMDGRGERVTTSYGLYRAGRYRRIRQIELPDSLGLLYERITEHLGFLRSSDEYKVMALASFGEDSYRAPLREMLRYVGDGVYRIVDIDLERALGRARRKGEPFERRHQDIARSLQLALEETVLQMVEWLHGQTNAADLCMAGGVALNCVLNARVRDRGPFRNVWVQPAAGDAGTALGAALLVDREVSRMPARRWSMQHAYWGPGFTDAEIEAFLHQARLPYSRPPCIARAAAGLLAQDKILGWFQGRMEFGPRALGARSVVASPIPESMQARLNALKEREDFRPVAPAVLEEEAPSWFVATGRGTGPGVGAGAASDAIVAPFMLFVYDVRPDKADRIPAVRHTDGTARIQTVARAHNPLYYDMIKAFGERTGVPIVVNTSFNTRGEPIVCNPRDAIECFYTSPLDALAIGSFLLEKPPS